MSNLLFFGMIILRITIFCESFHLNGVYMKEDLLCQESGKEKKSPRSLSVALKELMEEFSKEYFPKIVVTLLSIRPCFFVDLHQ